jgi:hypothetical protein
VHCGVFNLQAGVPSRRPFSNSITALNVSPSPSGLVPGGGAGGCGVECILPRWRRTMRIQLLLFILFQGPFCKVVGPSRISFFLLDHFVICNPPLF